MQTVRAAAGRANKPLVVVDYAHTPDALEKALSTVSAIVPDKGRLISVFGCGGDRDHGKRPLMGAISARYADFTIITSDNPRTEDPVAIVSDIAGGIGNAPHHVVVDRQQAIFEALDRATGADVVVIAGKGHEDYQIIGEIKRHFSDVEVATEALAVWKGRSE
jgi:UDP-N-acetylmuramyl tripeptide synthase